MFFINLCGVLPTAFFKPHSRFGTNHPAKVLVFMVCVFVALCAASFALSPYYDPGANAIRYFLDFGVVWVHCITLVFYVSASTVWVRVVLPAMLALTAIVIIIGLQRRKGAKSGDDDPNATLHLGGHP